MNCKCGSEIPPERLKILPDTKTCVKCSDVKKKKAIVTGSYKHKMVEIQVVDAGDPVVDYYEEQWRAR